MAYAGICVYMDLTKYLLEVIKMSWEDEDLVRTLVMNRSHFGVEGAMIVVTYLGNAP